MLWANFLHIYQPPTQKPYWVQRVAKESYIPLVEGLKRHAHAKITLNINAILPELLVRDGYQGLVKDIGLLAKRGQIEFTQSAKYHPLLTKLPEKEIIRQVELNDHTNKKFFGSAWKPQGFFPPEMAFDMRVAKVVHKLGYRWIIVDELSYTDGVKNIDWSTIYTISGLEGLSIFFRERHTSFQILSAQLGTGDMLLRELKDRLKTDTYLLTAMDGETFGHHRPGLEKLLFDLWKSDKLPSVRISDLFDRFEKREAVTPRASTWALQGHEIERNIPFARWDDPTNAIHKKQWALTNLLLREIEKANPKRKGYKKARALTDEALHSDQYWWASAKPWWSLEYIERGAKDHVDAITLIPGVSAATKKRAERLYTEILKTGFAWQRDGTVETLASTEDEEIRQRVDADRAFMSEKDFSQMVTQLKKQMLAAAKAAEFERAAQFRDRIRELTQERTHFTGKTHKHKKGSAHTHSIEDDWGF